MGIWVLLEANSTVMRTFRVEKVAELTNISNKAKLCALYSWSL